MSDSNEESEFLSFLFRIRSTRPLNRRDSRSVTHLAVSKNERKEQPIPYTNQRAAFEEFRTTGLKTFPSPDAGLQSLGWKKLTCGPKFQEGACATIRMAYKQSDRAIPLESRHLAVAKIQGVNQMTWTEVQILRGLVHDNIVDLYGVFAVDRLWRSEYADNYPKPVPERRILWILLEYANAGDLLKEVYRYEGGSIPENGARYYMLQVCKGLQYVHSKRIIHSDLHAKNVLLKYKSDGTKVCMICDFGVSTILGPDDDLDTHTQFDVASLSSILDYLVHNISYISAEAMQVIRAQCASDDHTEPKSVNELLSYPWFKRSASPPIPKTPTPLLQPKAVQQIGYLPPLDPAGTISPPTEPQFGRMTRAESRPASFAQRMGRNLRAFPRHVTARVRSLTGRDTTHGREQVAPEAEEDLPSRTGRIRNRRSSRDRAIARPFRHSSGRSEF